MIAACLMSLLLCAAGAALLGLVGALCTHLLQGDAMARQFAGSFFGTFNGVGVASTGYALLWFVHTIGRTFIAQVGTLVIVPERHRLSFARELQRAASWSAANVIAVPLAVLGCATLWWRGFPHAGFAKWYLAVCSFSIYYVASGILAFYLRVILLFRFIEDRSFERTSERVRLQSSPGSIELRFIDLFLVTSATFGLVTLYVGLRATLTASFADQQPFLRELLLLPFVLYLPATICYSIYPRYVLRQVSEGTALAAIEAFESHLGQNRQLSVKDDLELRNLVMDVKEKMLADCRAVPLLGLKDAPSLAMSLVIVLQFVVQRDTVIGAFVRGLFK